MYFPDLLAEYKQLLKNMVADGVTSGEMYNEVKQSIEWMETGYDPNEYKKRLRITTFPLDPKMMQEFVAFANGHIGLPGNVQALIERTESLEFCTERKRASVNDERKRVEAIRDEINEALDGLTENERAAFIAVRAEGMTFGKVAEMMGVSRGTVQVFVSRARKKINKNLEKSS